MMQKLLHAKLVGSGNPLLVLHGFLGMGDNWISLAKKYAEHGLKVHLIDQRNHGKSFHADEMNYEEMSADLFEYIQHYNLVDIILLGHSMGGKTAMDFSVKHPDLIKKLIVVDISPKFYAPHHNFLFDALALVSFEKAKTRKDIEMQLSQKIDSLPIRQFLMKNLKRNTQQKFQWKANIDVLRESLDELGEALPAHSTFKGETIFIKGEKSPYIQPEDSKLIRAHFPNSKLETIRNAGHWLHAEQPEQFLRKTLDFIKAV